MTSVQHIQHLIDDIKTISPSSPPQQNEETIQALLQECKTDYENPDNETWVMRGLGTAASVIVGLKNIHLAEGLINLFVQQADELFERRSHSKVGFTNVSPVADFLDRAVNVLKRSYGMAKNAL